MVFKKNYIGRVGPMYWTATTVKLIAILVSASLVLYANLDIGAIIKSYFFIPSVNSDGQVKPFLRFGRTLIYEMFFYMLFSLALYFKFNGYKSV
jgi:peptidoglycan/LPS O-acetylase OafA/YrhL